MPSSIRPYLFLTAAILAEIVGTSALESTDSFGRLRPSLLVVVGVSNAIWSGLGSMLLVIVAAVFLGPESRPLAPTSESG